MNVVILGAGFGGISAAMELERAGIPDLSVTLIDQSPHFYIGLTKLWVATGLRKPEDCLHPREALKLNGVRFVNEKVTSIDPATKTVAAGAESIVYDRLIIACGLEVRPDLVEGLEEHGHNLYAMEGAVAVHQALEKHTSGVIQVLICGPPFKCPPAPYEAALMIDDFLRKKGTRDQTEIVVSTPEPRPLPVLPTPVGEKIRSLLSQRGIEFRSERKVVRVSAGRIEFEGAEDPFDLLIAVPPHRSPSVVQPFNPSVTPAKMIPVDRFTLRTEFEGVYAIGDVAAVMTYKEAPVPRAGVLAEAQGKVVASQIASEILGGEAATFDGRGYCFLEVGDGSALRVNGKFFDPDGPSYEMEDSATPELFEEKRRFESERIGAWFA